MQKIGSTRGFDELKKHGLAKITSGDLNLVVDTYVDIVRKCSGGSEFDLQKAQEHLC